MVIRETTVHPWLLFDINAIAAFMNPFTSDWAALHPRMDSLRVVEQIAWLTISQYQQNSSNS